MLRRLALASIDVDDDNLADGLAHMPHLQVGDIVVHGDALNQCFCSQCWISWTGCRMMSLMHFLAQDLHLLNIELVTGAFLGSAAPMLMRLTLDHLLRFQVVGTKDCRPA